MNLKYYRFDEVTVNFDKKRVPLSSAQRSNRGGEFPYYGAQGVIDHIDDYIFDGEYLLIAEDGENLKSKKQNIAQIATGKFWVNNHAHIVTGNEKCDTRYLCYLINSMDLSGYITGSAQPKLSQANLNAVQLSMPTLEQQKRIVEYLVAIDNKIALNELINNNLEEQAVLLFKDWFTDFVNTSSNLIETRFGLIPDTFRLLKNGELQIVVTDYVANGSFASLKANVTLYQESNYAYFIRNTDLKSGSFEVFVDEHSYRFLSKSTLYGGEIIISNVGDVGSVFLCPKLNKPMTLGNNIIMLRSEQDNLKYYLYIWFKWLYGQSLIQGIKGGSAQPKFNKTDFKSLPIFLPPDDLLERFHQTVKPMFELIEKNNEENQGLRVIRDTLLPKLMSGELDVSNIDL